MEMVIVIVAVVVLGLAAMVAAGKLGEMKAEPVRDVYEPPLPADGELHGDDLEGVRFGVQARGYDMAEVDDLMARMARELDERDRRISELGEGRVPGRASVTKEPGDRVEWLEDRAEAEDEDPEPDPETRQKADRWRGKDEDESDWAQYRPGSGSGGSTRTDAP